MSLVEPYVPTVEAPQKSATATRPRRRANRVDERQAALLAVTGGVVAALSPASPTGNAAIDAVLIAAGVGAVVYAAASTPWWLLVLASLASLVVASDPPTRSER